MKRTLDTMSEAIALSSPSGKMSKRTRKAALDRLGHALFDGINIKGDIPEAKTARLLRSAANLRELAARGMSPRKFIREAEKLEAQAREDL